MAFEGALYMSAKSSLYIQGHVAKDSQASHH